MNNKFKLAVIDSKYCDYLRKFDERVPINFSKKENRPFVGVLFNVDKLEYFAPLSSPKKKHKIMSNMIDFLKIDNGNLGAVNFNNMIPVAKNNYKIIVLNKELDNEEAEKYRILLNNQLQWINSNSIRFKKKTKRLYNLYISKRLKPSIYNRCCNFPLLEEKCREYNKVKERV